MNKTVVLIVSVALILSLGGNAFQYYQHTQIQSQIEVLQEKYTAIESKLEQTSSNLDSANVQINELTKDLTKSKENYDKLNERNMKAQSDLSKVQETLSFVRCSTDISYESIKDISTNQSLIDPITSAVESFYSISSVNSSYEIIWNNSKDAIFTIMMSDRTSVKVAVSWSWKVSGRLLAIYDISNACYFYSYK